MVLPDTSNYGNAAGMGPLRPGGTSLASPSEEADLPSKLSHAAQRQRKALAVVRDTWAGTEDVRDENALKYLPQAPGEDTANYRERLIRSVFFNAFRRTVEGLTGLVFRRDPVLGDDVPPVMQEHWENIDNAGTHGDVFCRELLQDALVAGHDAILVDFPETGGAQTAADEMGTYAFRPYWVPVRKDQIVSWRTMNVAGRTVLTQVVLEECSYVPDGRFGEKKQVRYRVLFLDDMGPGWELLEVKEDKTVVSHGKGRFANQEEIPLAEVLTSGKRSLFDSDPPLLDLAHMNIAHYQQWSDYAFCIHKTNVPFIFGSGITQNRDSDGNVTKLVIGVNQAILDPSPEADAKYVAHDGAALGETRQSLTELKGDMATLGLAMLAQQKRAAETAEARRLDKATSDSALAVAARGLQDAVERALGFHARYLKLPTGGSVTVNRDFEGLAMDAGVMTAYASLIAQGLPWEVVIPELQEGGRIPEDVDPEALALEMAANRMAQEQAQEEARQAQLAMLEQDAA